MGKLVGEKGKEITVEEDSDKNLHSVMTMWTEDDDAKKKVWCMPMWDKNS